MGGGDEGGAAMAKPPADFSDFVELRRRGALLEFVPDCEGGATREESCCSRGSGVLNNENEDWNASESELMISMSKMMDTFEFQTRRVRFDFCAHADC